MKLRTTIILAAVCLGLFVFFQVTRRPGTPQARAMSGTPVFGGAEFEETVGGVRKGLSDLVERLEIRGSKGDMVLQRETANGETVWRVAAPVRRRADGAEVARVLNVLEFLERRRTLEPLPGEKLDLKGFGLMPAARVIRLSIGPKAWELRIGKPAPSGNEVYVARGDEDAVYVCANAIVHASEGGLNRFRDRAALRVEPSTVEEIRLKRKGGETVLERDGPRWRIVKPVKDVADADAVDQMLRALCGEPSRGLTGVEVAPGDYVADNPGDLKPYGLDAPRCGVTLKTGETTHGLLFGAPTEKGRKVYAQRLDEPSVFLLPVPAFRVADRSLSALRDPRLLRLGEGEAKGIEIEAPEPAESFRLVREGEGWRMTKPESTPADAERVDGFLRRLLSARVRKWIGKPDLAALGFEPPGATITVEREDGPPLVLHVGLVRKEGENKGVYLRRGDKGPVLLARYEGAAGLAGNRYLDFLPRTVLRFPKDSVVELSVVGPKRDTLLRKGKGEWRLVRPVEAEADLARVNDVLWDLCELRAKRLLARGPKGLKSYGLDPPALTVRLKREAGKRPVTHEVLIGGAAGRDSVNAYLKDTALLFALDKNVLHRLRKRFGRRRLLTIHPYDIAKIELRYADPAKTLRFTLDGLEWRPADKETKPLANGEVKDIARTVAGMRALSIVEYRPRDLKRYGLDPPRLTVTATLRDRKTARVDIGRAEKNQYYVRSGETGFLYLATRNDVMRLMKGGPAPPAKAPRPPEKVDVLL